MGAKALAYSKPLVRVIGFDDGSFKPRSRGQTCLVGVVYRVDGRVEGVLSTSIRVDGLDSTRKIVKLLHGSKFYPQVAAVLLQGVNFAGFNVADLPQLARNLNRPVLAVFRRRPDLDRIQLALTRLHDRGRRFRLIQKAGPIRKAGKALFQCAGIEEAQAARLIKKCCLHAFIPEPLRLAHLIASGLSLGESTRP